MLRTTQPSHNRLFPFIIPMENGIYNQMDKHSNAEPQTADSVVRRSPFHFHFAQSLKHARQSQDDGAAAIRRRRCCSNGRSQKGLIRTIRRREHDSATWIQIILNFQTLFMVQRAQKRHAEQTSERQKRRFVYALAVVSSVQIDEARPIRAGLSERKSEKSAIFQHWNNDLPGAARTPHHQMRKPGKKVTASGAQEWQKPAPGGGRGAQQWQNYYVIVGIDYENWYISWFAIQRFVLEFAYNKQFVSCLFHAVAPSLARCTADALFPPFVFKFFLYRGRVFYFVAFHSAWHCSAFSCFSLRSITQISSSRQKLFSYYISVFSANENKTAKWWRNKTQIRHVGAGARNAKAGRKGEIGRNSIQEQVRTWILHIKADVIGKLLTWRQEILS